MLFEGEDLQSEVSASPRARQIISTQGRAVCPGRELQHPSGQSCVSCRQLQHPPGQGTVSCCCPGPDSQPVAPAQPGQGSQTPAASHVGASLAQCSPNLSCIPWHLIHWHSSTSQESRQLYSWRAWDHSFPHRCVLAEGEGPLPPCHSMGTSLLPALGCQGLSRLWNAPGSSG